MSMKYSKMVIMAKLVTLILLLEAMVTSSFRIGPAAGSSLSMDYYVMSCAFVEPVVGDIVNQAFRNDPNLAAGLIRMHFHDCFIQGCDGSILIDSTKDNTAEKDSPGNLSLRGYEVIDKIKAALEAQCPGVVSCADILALAARDAVFFADGPWYDIPKGRKDGSRSKIQDTINLPFPTFNASVLISVFGQRGFTPRDIVALSGAHTLGVARCSSFKNRISGGKAIDPTLVDSEFAESLSKTCSAGDNAEQAFDATKNVFDNLYFDALTRNNGLLTSDQTLYTHPETKNFVDAYAFNQAMFFFDFQQAMIKMGGLDVKLGSNGQVRLNCRKVN